MEVRKFVVQTLWRAGLPCWSLGRQTYFLLRFSWLCLPTWHLWKSLCLRTSHTIAQNLSISAGPTALTNQFFSGTYYSPSKTHQCLERDSGAGSSHWTRCPAGQSRNTRRPQRTFSKQSHARQLALTPPSQRLRTGPPPACHPHGEPTQEWVRPLSHHRWIIRQSRTGEEETLGGYISGHAS